ncbi:MAG: hypothetical protein K6L80_07755 [Agarilytica sp.]
MDNQNIIRQFIRAVLHEMFRSKTAYNVLASVILLSVIAVGYFWQESYVSHSAISRSQSQLQTRQATAYSNHLQQLSNIYDAYSFQEQMVVQLGPLLPSALTTSQSKISYLRHHSQLVIDDNNVVRLQFRSDSPSKAQKALSIITEGLLNRVQPQKDDEYIELRIGELQQKKIALRTQYQSLQQQISEHKLTAGSTFSSGASARLQSITEALQDVEVNIAAVDAKIEGIRRRLSKEDALHESAARIAQLETQKKKTTEALTDNLNVYSSNAPEIVSLQQELDNINVEMVSITERLPLVSKPSRVSDALYEQLRQQLTLEELERESLLSRQASLVRIQHSEKQKANAGQSHVQALQQLEKESDLAKAALDEVSKALETAMLTQRKDRETAGSFVVLDKPNLPQTYSGLGFIEFLILGPILAFGLPFSLAMLIVMTDSRIRTSRHLKRIVPDDIAVLGVIPHYNSPKTLRVFHKAVFGLVMWGAFVFIVYFTIGVIGLKA